MKRVNEVFELPLESREHFTGEGDIYKESGEFCAAFETVEQAQHAARAINHADALADALEALINSSENYAANFKSEYFDAIDALAAYRGEK